jgi:putative peptidoglycan lipid II flippase
MPDPTTVPAAAAATQDSHDSVLQAAGVVGVATFSSRILGFIRDMVLARLFGATPAADAFFVAFRIPSLLRELFAEGSMSSAFIPVFTGTGRSVASRRRGSWRAPSSPPC